MHPKNMHITLCVKHVVTKKRECFSVTRYPEMSGMRLFVFLIPIWLNLGDKIWDKQNNRYQPFRYFGDTPIKYYQANASLKWYYGTFANYFAVCKCHLSTLIYSCIHVRHVISVWAWEFPSHFHSLYCNTLIT